MRRGLVGVEDRAVLRPHLHADHRLAEDLALHDVVELLQVDWIAGEHAVAEDGGLDQLALDLDALAGVALGLLDGHVAQGEEAADEDDRDRGEAAEHEPGHGGRDPRGRRTAHPRSFTGWRRATPPGP